MARSQAPAWECGLGNSGFPNYLARQAGACKAGFPSESLGASEPVSAKGVIMLLVACEKCGGKVSKNAKACPHCNQPLAKIKWLPCRICGENLEELKHRVEIGGRYRTACHTPCPKCGEPEPLQKFTDTARGQFVASFIKINGFFVCWAVAWISGSFIEQKAGGVVAFLGGILILILLMRYVVAKLIELLDERGDLKK
jgi:hypothetical protein